MSFASELLKNPQAKVEDCGEPGCPPVGAPEACPNCHGKLKDLGSLGRRNHYKCEGCGQSFTEPSHVRDPMHIDFVRRAPRHLESITEAVHQVQHRILESIEAGKPLTFSPQQVLALRQLLEAADADPFANTEPVLDTSDLEVLKLNIEPDTDEGNEAADPFSLKRDGRPTVDPVGTDRINVEIAIVAPDATPNHDEPIPASVLAALEVLQSGGQERPVTPNPVPEVTPTQTPAPAPGGMPSATPADSGGPSQVEAMAKFRQLFPELAATLVETKPAPIPLRGNNPPVTGPVLAEDAVPIGAIMGNWRKSFKETQ